MPSLPAASSAEAEPEIPLFPHFRYFPKSNVGWLALLAPAAAESRTEGNIIEGGS
jgi:hypothetical protein